MAKCEDSGEGARLVESLAERVMIALNDLCLKPDEREWGNTGWTQRVKSAVTRLAHDAGHKAYASRGVPEADGREWLYDVTWLDHSPKDDRLIRTILVLESEWSWSWKQIVYDFHKLLVARADLRVMVFQVSNESKWKETAHRLISLIEQHEQTSRGDRYLLSGWVQATRSFRHHEYVHGTTQTMG